MVVVQDMLAKPIPQFSLGAVGGRDDEARGKPADQVYPTAKLSRVVLLLSRCVLGIYMRVFFLLHVSLASTAEVSRKTVHFVRHGEAEHNPRAEAKRAAGCSFAEFFETMLEDDVLDAPLTALGIEQAEATHSRVASSSIQPELVVVSPHVRAIDTARIVFPQCSGGMCRMTPFVIREELRERSGVMLNVQRRKRSELQSIAEYSDCDFSALQEDDTLWTPEVESWESTSERGHRALEYIWSRPEVEIAVVCHGGVLEAILNCIPDGEYTREDVVVEDAALTARFRNAECRSAVLERRDEDGAFVLRALQLSGGGGGEGPVGRAASSRADALSRRAALSAIGGALPLTAAVINDCRRITEASQQADATERLAAGVEHGDGMTPAARFKRVPKLIGTEFIAAVGDPSASSGCGAEHWGIWRDDPGPPGVLLRDFEANLVRTGGRAPAGWRLDDNAWWLEEYGRIMPSTTPLPAGKYVVSGERETTSVLTVRPNGEWALSSGSLFDVTHLPCRSALYTPANPAKPGSCSPASADPGRFRVPPGAPMPEVPGCNKQDHAVLFVLGYAT